jgi:predicted small secreted protein
MKKSLQIVCLALVAVFAVAACKPTDSGAGSGTTSAGAAQSSSHSTAVPSVPDTNTQGQHPADTNKK